MATGGDHIIRGETYAREGVEEQNKPIDSGKTRMSSRVCAVEEVREATSAERPQVLSHHGYLC